ncbi:MAG: hypothetical protein F6K09_33415 [Merismopedia sp. SIO2A8]|nr:hypothetical protein [Merismopedia sp. SIO2A8]
MLDERPYRALSTDHIPNELYNQRPLTLPLLDQTEITSIDATNTNTAIARASNDQVISVNLWELLRNGDLDEDMRLQDGDRIIIPTATALSPGEQTELASSNISADITVNVVGEVGAPGTIAVRPDTPLNQAILTAGGFTNRAKTSEVDLIRLNADGTVSQREIDIDFSQSVDETTNPALRPNDTIVVRRSGLARTEDTVRSVLSPLNGLPALLRLFGL